MKNIKDNRPGYRVTEPTKTPCYQILYYQNTTDLYDLGHFIFLLVLKLRCQSTSVAQYKLVLKLHCHDFIPLIWKVMFIRQRTG
jgi:hypothetical protein